MMKLFTGITALLITISAACQTTTNNATAKQVLHQPVVIELFTSEGCSSCPAADALLTKISDADTNVLLLSYHVDYWNRLGWTDSFSNHQFSERQNQYAAHFKKSGIYTPQAIVNGAAEVVGSNNDGLQHFINATYPQKKYIQKLTAKASQKNIEVVLKADTTNSIIYQVLLVQPNAITNVKAGENEGALLHHKNIVRAIATYKQGIPSVHISAPFVANNWKVVVLASDKKSLNVKDMRVINVL